MVEKREEREGEGKKRKTLTFHLIDPRKIITR